jgi:hypothetical protein
VSFDFPQVLCVEKSGTQIGGAATNKLQRLKPKFAIALTAGLNPALQSHLNSSRHAKSLRSIEHSILRVQQDKGDAARRVSAVHPGVVGATLNEYVACLQVNFRIVEEHVDLSR